MQGGARSRASPAPAPAPTATPDPNSNAVPTPTPPTPTPVPGDATSEGGLSPLVWVGFGVGGAGLVLGAITGGVSISQTNTLKDSCGTNVTSCTVNADDYSTANTLANVSNVSFAVAGVGAVVGVIGLLMSGGEEQPTQELGEVRIDLAPTGPNEVGLRVVF